MKPLILFDHEIFAIQRFGGITRIFVELMRRLAVRHDIAVAWHRGFHSDGYDVSDFSGRLIGYCAMPESNFTPQALSDGSANCGSLSQFAQSLGKRVDVLHTTYFDPTIPNIVPHRKLAITIHDMIPEIYFKDIPRFESLLKGKAELIQRADLIFVNSMHTHADLKHFFPDLKAEVVLTPWASSLQDVVPALLPSSVESLGRPFLLYVGTRSKYKNFQVLMDAFAQFPELRQRFAVVVFGGTGDFLSPETKFFAKHGLTSTFHYVSGGDDVLKALYCRATALVYTSRYEGFGLPPLEAMENGCPVICCSTSSLPEVVGDDALFFSPDAPSELSQQLNHLVDEPSIMGSLIEAGKLRATRFNWQHTTELTVNAYKKILQFQ